MIFFVTGGSRGIGAAIVLEAARAGHDVAFTYVQAEGAAHEIARQCAQIAPERRFHAYRLDVSNSAEVESVGDRVLEDFGSVDVIVANAAISRSNLVASMSDQEWHEVINTNLSGPFYVVRHFLPTLLAQRFGRIILMSSIAANGSSGQAGYCASKAGLLGLSATLSKEYGKKGITSNVISPGFIETEMTRELMSDRNREFWLKHVPVGRLGELSEVSKLVVFLASPGAGYMNGLELRVDGGLDWAP